jgi:hypothetical protein
MQLLANAEIICRNEFSIEIFQDPFVQNHYLKANGSLTGNP